MKSRRYIYKRIFVAVVFFVFCVGIVFFSKIEIISIGTGIISQGGGKIDIYTPGQGVVSELAVSDGAKVRSGEQLFVLIDSETNERINGERRLISFLESVKSNASATINDLTAFIDTGRMFESKNPLIKDLFARWVLNQTKKKSAEMSSSVLLDEIKEIEQQIKLSSEQERLYLNSSASKIEKINSSKIKSELISIKLQKKRELDASINEVSILDQEFFAGVYGLLHDEVLKKEGVEKELLRASNDIKALIARNSLNRVISPVSGVVLSRFKNISNGSFVEKNIPIITLNISNNETLVKAKFQSKYRPFLQDGGRVKGELQVPGKRVVFYGHLKNISADSFKFDERDESNRYYSADVIVENMPKEGVEGVGVKLFAIMKDVRLISYLFGVMYSPVEFNAG